MKQRKYINVLYLQANYGYGHGWEDLTAAYTRWAIGQYLNDYNQNEGGDYRIVTRREPITPDALIEKAREIVRRWETKQNERELKVLERAELEKNRELVKKYSAVENFVDLEKSAWNMVENSFTPEQ